MIFVIFFIIVTFVSIATTGIYIFVFILKREKEREQAIPVTYRKNMQI